MLQHVPCMHPVCTLCATSCTLCTSCVLYHVPSCLARCCLAVWRSLRRWKPCPLEPAASMCQAYPKLPHSTLLRRHLRVRAVPCCAAPRRPCAPAPARACRAVRPVCVCVRACLVRRFSRISVLHISSHSRGIPPRKAMRCRRRWLNMLCPLGSSPVVLKVIAHLKNTSAG